MAVWRQRQADPDRVASLKALGHGDIVSRVLVLRGQDAQSVEEYLRPSLKRLAAPSELPGVERAADIILDQPGDVVVFGDYDCDGVSATAIMLSALNAIRPGCAAAFIPERLSEGYGMSDRAVGRMLKEHPDVKLVVTVDNGIGALKYVKALKARGVKVVVTDHHLAGDDLAELESAADALVNPKVAAPDKLSDLCGAGVAFILAGALVEKARQRGIYSGPAIGGPLLVMAGLATVTDIMPLTGQNRILVAEALKRFRTLAPVGLKELYRQAAKSMAPSLDCRDFGFLIGPRINAAGRMGSGTVALKLMLERDPDEAGRLAYEVKNLNHLRKSAEAEMLAAASGQIVKGAPAQLIDLPDGHQGVAGIVASRIMESCPLGPVAVIAGGHGSCRAPDGFNVHDLLAASAEALSSFGGHAQAGGFSVKPGAMEEFRRLFLAASSAQAEAMAEAGTSPGVVWYDAETEGRDLTLELAASLKALEPFGEGNEEPVFRLCNAYLSNVKTIGFEGKHLALEFKESRIPRAVWWNGSGRLEDLRAHSSQMVDVLFKLTISEYGQRHAELMIVALEYSDNIGSESNG